MALHLAIGGGGDVVMAAVLAGGGEVGHIPWERYTVDPEPGPVPLSSFINAAVFDDGVAIATGGSHVERGGRRFKTQGICVAETLGKSIYVVDSYLPPSRLARSLARFKKVVGVDVGGDVLAVGCEEEVGSPLSDAYGLALLAMLKKLGVETEVVVMSPGADGELDREYFLQRAAEVARMGGFLGSVGLSKGQLELLSALTRRCVTEASTAAARAAFGEWGEFPIRGGARRVKIDLFSTVGFRFDPEALLKVNKAARIVYERDASMDKAAELLLAAGIPTEWHLETLLSKGVEYKDAVSTLKKLKRCHNV
ncbi:MAG: DUF1152 domain-containing protein [Pyrobaculum sp.]